MLQQSHVFFREEQCCSRTSREAAVCDVTSPSFADTTWIFETSDADETDSMLCHLSHNTAWITPMSFFIYCCSLLLHLISFTVSHIVLLKTLTCHFDWYCTTLYTKIQFVPHREQLHPLRLYRQKDRRCTYKRNTEGSPQNHCCTGKAINITFSECL